MVTLNKLNQFNLNKTEMIFDCLFHPSKPNCLALSTIEGDIIMIDIDNKSIPINLHLKKHHKGSSIRKLTFSSDHLLVTASKTIKLFDLNAEKFVRTINNNNSKIFSLLVIDHYLLCCGNDDGRFRVWDYRVDRGTAMDLKECDDYISDLDIDSNKRIVVASSGEGTLTAFNIRARKIDGVQSELFDAGFQCVRYYEPKKKVLVGAEDGAINIFNVNEWGNISNRIPARGNTGKKRDQYCINNLEVLTEKQVVVTCSDGKVRILNMFPNKIIFEEEVYKSSIESLALAKLSHIIATTSDNCIFIYKFQECKESKENSKETSQNFFSDL